MFPEREDAELSCPYCGAPFSEYKPVTDGPDLRIVGDCPGCNRTYHDSCWKQNKGCSGNVCPKSPYTPGSNNWPINILNSRPSPGAYLHDLLIDLDATRVRAVNTLLRENPWIRSCASAKPIQERLSWAQHCATHLTEFENEVKRKRYLPALELYNKCSAEYFTKTVDFTSHHRASLEEARQHTKILPLLSRLFNEQDLSVLEEIPDIENFLTDAYYPTEMLPQLPRLKEQCLKLKQLKSLIDAIASKDIEKVLTNYDPAILWSVRCFWGKASAISQQLRQLLDEELHTLILLSVTEMDQAKLIQLGKLAASTGYPLSKGDFQSLWKARLPINQ